MFPAIPLKQSTAVTVKAGPLVDETDGYTAETALTITQADIQLSKNGGSLAQTNNSAGATHDSGGVYDVPLDTTDTGTLGILTLVIHESGARPFRQDFIVIPAVVYDSLVSGSDYLQVDAVQVEGSDATDQIRDAVVDDATRIDASALNTASTAIGSDGAGLTEAGGTGDQFTAVPWNSAWDTEVESECTDAMTAIGLDHLLSASVAGTDITDDSIIAKLVSSSATADWDDYDNQTDSMQALRDWIGDGSNLTEAGGTGDHLTAIAWNAAWDAEVQSEVADALAANNDFYLLKTTVSSVDSATVFVLSDGVATDDYYNDKRIVVIDADDTSVRWSGNVSDYVGSTKTLTVDATPGFTVAASDVVFVLPDVVFDPDSDNVTVGSLSTAAINSLANSEIEVIGAIQQGGKVVLVKGDDYTNSELTFEKTANEDHWPTDLSDGSVAFSAQLTSEDDPENPTGTTIDITGSVVTATGDNRSVKFDSMTDTVTAALDTGQYNYQILWTATADGRKVTLRRGENKLTVKARYPGS